MTIEKLSSPVPGQPPQEPQANAARLKKACNDFEGVFLNYILKTMRQTLSGNGLFGNSLGQGIYESMYDQELAAQIAHGRGLGLGEALYRELQAKAGMEK